MAGDLAFREGLTPPSRISRTESVQVSAALSSLAEEKGHRAFTVQEDRDRSARGTSYAERIVFKTIQRMKGRAAHPTNAWSGSTGRVSGLWPWRVECTLLVALRRGSGGKPRRATAAAGDPAGEPVADHRDGKL